MKIHIKDFYEFKYERGQTSLDIEGIVRVVNCHDELVDVVKDIMTLAPESFDKTSFWGKAQKALAKAENKD